MPPVNRLPSVDEVLRNPITAAAIESFGRTAVVDAVRAALQMERQAIETQFHGPPNAETELSDRCQTAQAIALAAAAMLASSDVPNVRRVFNLTGTVLHTNLGRAVLAEVAIQAAVQAMRHPVALEFDVETGGRGERDSAVRGLICDLTGAEDAIAVNNNAAAVLLVLNTLGIGKETIVSRGELIEIGGAFRMPDIMARAGTKLVEVGTTNRTHMRDYEGAIGPETAMLMKVHTSNYLIQGFTAEVPARELAALALSKGLALVNDLGSGTLVDLRSFGLRPEPTVMDAVREGADIVTFSGDKLLGGVQAGFIVGRRDLVQRCAKNPMKRAMRLDKIRLAALEATLRLYRDPERLADRLPTLRLLTRGVDELRATAERIVPTVRTALRDHAFAIEIGPCTSQIGSGALPLETIPSVAIRFTAIASRRDSGRRIQDLAAAFRALEIPVIGRIEKGVFLLDLRCLDDETAFVEGMPRLQLADR